MTILSNNNNEEENKKSTFIIRKISSEDDVALLPRLQHTKSVVATYAESIRRQRSDSFVHSRRLQQQQPTINNNKNNESRSLSIYNDTTDSSDIDIDNINKHSNQENSMLHAKILSAATVNKPSSLTNITPTLHINTSISYNNNNNNNNNNNTNNNDTGAILEGILIRRAIRPASLLPQTKEDTNNSSPSSESPSSSSSESPEEPKSLSISISTSTLASTTTKSSPSIITPSPPLPPPIQTSSTTSSLSNESMLQHPWEPPSLITNNNNHLNNNNNNNQYHNNNNNYNHIHASQSNHSLSSTTTNDDHSSLKQPSSLFKRLAHRHHHGLNLTRDDMLSPENILYPPSTPTLDQETELDKYGFQKATQWLSLETYHDFEKQYQPILDRRRLKWQQLLDENEQKLPDRCTQIKRYIRKGVPSHLRGHVWLHYSGAEAKMDANPGVYEKFLNKAMEMGDESEFADLIERDLHRTFPDNIQFSRAVALARSSSTSSKSTTTISTPPLSSTSSSSSSPSSSPTATNDNINNNNNMDDFIPPAIDVLRRVLRVFSVYCPSVGYCQSLNYLVGMLLLFMKEEEAFWCLVTMVQNILPAGVYDVTMEGSSIDQTVLMMLLHERMPQFWYKLTNKSFWEAEADGVSMPTITLVTSHWFLTLFINILPTESMLRIWDCFFYEGSNALFRVSLALFKMVEPCILELNDPLEIFQVVQNFPKRMIDCQLLIDCAYRKYPTFTDVSNEELDRRREICRELRKARRSMTPSELAANRSKFDTTPRKRWKLIVNPSVSHHVLRK